MFCNLPSMYDLGNSANDNVATCASKGLMNLFTSKRIFSELELHFEK